MKIVIHSLLGIYRNHHAFDKEITMNFSIDLLKFFLWTIIQNNFYVYPKIKNIEKWILYSRTFRC